MIALLLDLVKWFWTAPVPMSASKSYLLSVIREGLSMGGYALESVSGQHPADLVIRRPDGNRYQARVYIWNVTPGGNNRPAHERRIQLTGSRGQEIVLRHDAPTALLGWHDETGVFVQWEAERYQGLMRSPSLQVPLDTLEAAAARGVDRYVKGGQSGVAVAFRPELLGERLDLGLGSPDAPQIANHDAGLLSPLGANLFGSLVDPFESREPFTDLDLLGALGTGGRSEFELPPSVGMDTPSDVSGYAAVPPPGQRARRLVTRQETERDPSFAGRVLVAYGYHCAFTGMGMGIVQAAHIIPVSDVMSDDKTWNGIALSPAYHWAYDQGMIAFAPDGTIWIDYDLLKKYSDLGYINDVFEFVRPLRDIAYIPDVFEDRPHPGYVAYANSERGWGRRVVTTVREIRAHLGLG